MTNNLLTIIKGDTANIVLNLKKSDGDPLDLTNATVYFTVKKDIAVDDEDAEISKDITSHVDDAGGETLIELNSADTNITPGNYVWDIQVKDDEDNVFSTQVGSLTILQDVTNRS